MCCRQAMVQHATPAPTDTDLTIATTGLPGGEGIVYDPSAGDPNFANVGTQTFPPGLGGQQIRSCMSRGAANATKVAGVPTGDGLITLKGDLTATGNVIIGRSSNVRDTPTNGTIIQKGGKFVATLGTMDLAQTETTQDGYGNGTWDYRSGNYGHLARWRQRSSPIQRNKQQCAGCPNCRLRRNWKTDCSQSGQPSGIRPDI